MNLDNDFIANANIATKLLKVLAHPDRLLVMCYLSECELSAGELAARSKLSVSAFSQHLAILRNAELIKTRRDAQTIYYSIKDSSALKIISTLKEIYCDTLY